MAQQYGAEAHDVFLTSDSHQIGEASWFDLARFFCKQTRSTVCQNESGWTNVRFLTSKTPWHTLPSTIRKLHRFIVLKRRVCSIQSKVCVFYILFVNWYVIHLSVCNSSLDWQSEVFQNWYILASAELRRTMSLQRRRRPLLSAKTLRHGAHNFDSHRLESTLEHWAQTKDRCQRKQMEILGVDGGLVQWIMRKSCYVRYNIRKFNAPNETGQYSFHRHFLPAPIFIQVQRARLNKWNMRPIGRICTRNVGHGISILFILFLQVGSRELSSFLDMSGATSDFETNRGLWRQWRRHWKQCRSPAGHSAQGQWSGWHRGNPVQSDSNLAGHQGLSLSWKAWNMGCGFS